MYFLSFSKGNLSQEEIKLIKMQLESEIQARETVELLNRYSFTYLFTTTES